MKDLQGKTRISIYDKREPAPFGESSKRQILALLVSLAFLGAIILLLYTFIELLNGITDTTITNHTRFTVAGSKKMPDKFYAYVPHHRQRLFEEKGWVFEAYLDYPHAAYSSMYRWAGDGDPIMPDPDIGVVLKAKKENDENN